MSTDPNQSPDPQVEPSSTPDGPQVIPAPSTPEGEPGPDASEKVHFDNKSSNPSSGGPAGLGGDLGISSERTFPDPAEPASAGPEYTGNRGDVAGRTDGEADTTPTEWDAVDVSQGDVHPERPEELDDTQGVNDQTGDYRAGLDRTVGEPRPNPIQDEKLRR